MKKKKSIFIPITAWIFILGAGLMLPLVVMQNIILHELFEAGTIDDATITAYNPVEVAFFSNLRFFLGLMGVLNLLFLIGSIALLKRRRWSRFLLSALLGLGILSLAILVGSFLGYDYEVTAWRDPERNRRFAIYFPLVSASLCLLMGWLIYKLNSARIAEKLR